MLVKWFCRECYQTFEEEDDYFDDGRSWCEDSEKSVILIKEKDGDINFE